MRNREYTEREIDTVLRNLGKRKAHGIGGIPRESYKSARKWEIETIAKIMGRIKDRRKYLITGPTAR